MKNAIISSLFFLTSMSIASEQNEALNLDNIDYKIELEVEVNALRNTAGVVLIALHNNGEGFPGSGAVYNTVITNLASGKLSARFNAIPIGEYAIAVIHDENSDGDLETNFLGIPTEGYGFSNNVIGSLGPPSYKDAAFIVDKTTNKLSIDIVY